MKTLFIGRNTDNDIVIGDTFVSGRHISLSLNDDGSVVVKDLGSSNGTYVNGKKIAFARLMHNDILKIGDTVLPWQEYVYGNTQYSGFSGKIIRQISIGRNAGCDVVIKNDVVSGRHATLYITDKNEMLVEDHDSTNGTYVNDVRIKAKLLKAGDTLRLGSHLLKWEAFLAVQNTSKPLRLKTRRKANPWLITTMVLGSILFSIAAVWIGIKMYNGSTYIDDSTYINENPGDTLPVFSNLAQMVKYIEKAVFMIETQGHHGQASVYGTGFFISSSGLGITNAHVVENGSKWVVKTSAKEVYKVSDMLVVNTTYDYAIFRVGGQGRHFNFLKLADNAPEKGEEIIVLGNPQGIESTLTKGIVSGAKGGTEQDIVNGRFSEGNTFLQIDVAISHGSSGSPVMNMKGEVVGIATLSFEEANCVNCNFAVNVQLLKNDIARLRE